MNCQKCNAPSMRTIETFSMPAMTVRKKKCKVCLAVFTTWEEITEPMVIPKAVRNKKENRKVAL